MRLGTDVESGNGAGLKKGFLRYDEEFFGRYIKPDKERRKPYAKQITETTKEHNLSNIEANISEQTGSHARENIQEDTKINIKANILTPLELEIINIINKNMAGLKEEIIRNRQELTELRKNISSLSYESSIEEEETATITLDQIKEKGIYIQAKDSVQEELLANELYGNHIPFDDFYNPRDDKTAYRVSHKIYAYLVQKGIDLQIIEVTNIGDLSLEERTRIKRHHKSQITKRRKDVLDELRTKYGILR